MKRRWFKVAVRMLASIVPGLLLATIWLASGSAPAYAQSGGFADRASGYVVVMGYVRAGPNVVSGYFVNRLSSRCVDVYGAPGKYNGTSLQLWDCEYSGYGPTRSSTDQKWELTSDGFIKNKLSGKCIDVQGSPGVANGALLQLWDCEYSGRGPSNSPTDQRWELTPDGFIRNKLSGRCIDVQGTPGVYNGSRLQLWDCEYRLASTDQRWTPR